MTVNPDSQAADIEAREQHVIGNGPRIEAIPNDVIDPEIRAIVNRTRAAVGAGEIEILPEYTRLIAKNPPIFRNHMEMGTAIFLGQIPPRERELAVLRIAWLCRAPFEWGEHVNIAKRYGVAAEEVERAIEGSSATGWTKHEAAILKGVEEFLDNQTLSDRTYEQLTQSWSEPQIIEYLMVVAHYVGTAFVQNSLRVPLAEGNTGLSMR